MKSTPPMSVFKCGDATKHLLQGWRIYKKRFFVFTFLYLAYFVITYAVSNALPIVSLLMGLVLPFLARVGFWQIIKNLASPSFSDSDQNLLADFFCGFRFLSRDFFTWIKLGLLQSLASGFFLVLGVGIPALILWLEIFKDGNLGTSSPAGTMGLMGAFLKNPLNGETQTQVMEVFGPVIHGAMDAIRSANLFLIFGSFVFAAICAQIYMYIYFSGLMAPYFVFFERKSAKESFKSSVRLVFKNWIYFKWVTFLYTVIFLLFVLFTLGVGTLIVLPMAFVFIPWVWISESNSGTQNQRLELPTKA